MKSQNSKTIHIVVSGRVQGVGYRAFTQKTALTLGVVGWVKNLTDGRVEAMCASTEEVLSIFLQELKKGPLFSKVIDVTVKEISEKIESKSFEINRD